jgi:transposase
MKTTTCRYVPDAVKRQAAERVETSGPSIMDVAAEQGVDETRPRRWTGRFGKAGAGPARRRDTAGKGPVAGRAGGGERPVETVPVKGPDAALPTVNAPDRRRLTSMDKYVQPLERLMASSGRCASHTGSINNVLEENHDFECHGGDARRGTGLGADRAQARH